MAKVELTLSDDVMKAMKKAAELTGLSVASLIEDSISDHLDEIMEDAEDYADAVKGWNEYVADGMKGTTLEDFEKELLRDNSFVEPIQEAI